MENRLRLTSCGGQRISACRWQTGNQPHPPLRLQDSLKTLCSRIVLRRRYSSVLSKCSVERAAEPRDGGLRRCTSVREPKPALTLSSPRIEQRNTVSVALQGCDQHVPEMRNVYHSYRSLSRKK